MAKKLSVKIKDVWDIQTKFNGHAAPFELKLSGVNKNGTLVEITAQCEMYQLQYFAEKLWDIFKKKQAGEAQQNKWILEALVGETKL